MQGNIKTEENLHYFIFQVAMSSIFLKCNQVLVQEISMFYGLEQNQTTGSVASSQFGSCLSFVFDKSTGSCSLYGKKKSDLSVQGFPFVPA